MFFETSVEFQRTTLHISQKTELFNERGYTKVCPVPTVWVCPRSLIISLKLSITPLGFVVCSEFSGVVHTLNLSTDCS
jgi:hypothetical protein